MTWAQQETQKTIYDLLANDEELIELIGENKVFDFTPDNSPYPFITFFQSGDTWADRGSHTTEGWDARLQINVWYRGPGRGKKEVQNIQARIDQILHKQDICVEGWNIIAFRRQTATILTEPDNVTLHGVQIYKLLLGEVF